ncbi:hypothetical protein ACIBF5_29795 [Micromonospora sp. NPDC050417]|uniref:hypothetical protein n=1 Tax=Micromonospora sp. NPDC050417 TaxID=3364280 RepID=UPI00378AA42E
MFVVQFWWDLILRLLRPSPTLPPPTPPPPTPPPWANEPTAVHRQHVITFGQRLGYDVARRNGYRG